MGVDVTALTDALNAGGGSTLTGAAPATPRGPSMPPDPVADATWAILTLRQQRPLYRLYEDYYHGRHRLTFASERWRSTFGDIYRKFVDNLCRTVVNTPADKLQIAGFTNAAGEDVGPAQDLWREQKLHRKSGEVHKEALRCGDAYVIAWRDEVTGDVDVYPQRADQCVVRYDPDRPDTIAFGMKWWALTDGRVRANLYYPDQIVKLVTRRAVQGDLPQSGKSFIPWVGSGPDTISNPYGIVPVFAFHNDADTGCLGQSELEDVVPLADALNKAVIDLLVAMEFMGYPQRWATGLELPQDPDTGAPVIPFQAGLDRLWHTGDTETKFGQFPSADLGQIVQVIDSFRLEIARVSGIPLHYLMLDSGQWPSGEAMKTAEARTTAKVEDRQTVWGEEWAALMGFLLQLSGHAAAATGIKTRWKPAEPRSEQVFYTNLIAKQQLGVPDETLWSEMGYGEDEIEQFKQQAAAKSASDALMASQLFNGGDPSATGGAVPVAPSAGASAGGNLPPVNHPAAVAQRAAVAATAKNPGNPGLAAMQASVAAKAGK